MLVCPNCGADNELGRVFCASCGTKLDLSNMSSDTVAKSINKGGLFKRHWRKGVIAIGCIIAIDVFLAMWPKADRLGDCTGTRIGETRVSSAIIGLSKMQSGAVSLSEKDVNAFLRFSKADKFKVVSISTQFLPGRFYVRVVKRLMTVNLTLFQWTPTVSYDMICMPYGNRLKVKSVHSGHLLLVGPFASSVRNKLHKMVAGEKEWSVLSKTSGIKVKGGSIIVGIKK